MLVNNVGGTVGDNDPFTGDDDAFERTLVLCLTSAWWTTKVALPGMRDQGFGRIVNIGSGASKHTGASLPYTAAKHGLVGFTKEIAKTGAPHGVNANVLCPGWTRTSLVDFERIARARGTTAARRNDGPRPRACRTGCSTPTSWRAWPPCWPATTAGASPARSSASTAATRSDPHAVRRPAQAVIPWYRSRWYRLMALPRRSL